MNAPAEILFATGNAHKVAEMAAFAMASASQTGGPLVKVVMPPHMPPVVEDAGTFEGNAAKKARALRERAPDSWILADDSGLCVDALGGAPGVESANYAGPAASGPANVAKLLDALKEVPPERRTARFVCVLCVIAPDGRETLFEGHVGGTILGEPRGDGGFGYDPVFKPHGFAGSFAELGEAVKNPVSHRGRAWRELAAWLGSGAELRGGGA